MNEAKTVCEESNNRLKFKKELIKFGKNYFSDKGAIFFGVCGGKLSSIDFTDDMARCVVMVGVPYPNSNDPNIAAKKKYLDERVKNVPDQKSYDGKKWYEMKATRAINQAIGRVITHKDDFGSIFLLDERFAESKTFDSLSAWAKPIFKTSQDFFDDIAELPDFYDSAKQFVIENGGNMPSKISANDFLSRIESDDDKNEINKSNNNKKKNNYVNYKRAKKTE